MPDIDLDRFFDTVPPSRTVRELLSSRIIDVQKLRALLRLAEQRERLEAQPQREGAHVP
jgi:hypothetical protein